MNPLHPYYYTSGNINMDDEPYSMEWLSDFIISKGYIPINATTFEEALRYIDNKKFCASVIDMNIPFKISQASSLKKRADIYNKYPGLHIAHELRDSGADKNAVIIFTVHDNQEIASIARALDIKYVIKGKPKQVKAALENQFNYLDRT